MTITAKLIIRIVNNQPYEYPMTLNNFKQAFPEVDLGNLPSEFAWCDHTPEPRLGPLDKSKSYSFQLIDGVYKQVWTVEPLSGQEKSEKLTAIRQAWLDGGGYASWTLNLDTGEPTPPTPRPKDGKLYIWDEQQLMWIEEN